MPRIIYLCPADNVPTGGIKVIYRHAALLSELGTEAFVLHPFDTSFQCSWFEHSARFLDSLTLDPSSDFVIIPELWAGIFGPQCLKQTVRYAVFVQNGYLTHPVLPQHSAALMETVYRGADLVLAISDDTARMVALNYPTIDQTRVVRSRYSVAKRFLSPSLARKALGRGRTITFMPRKMADHAVRVVFALRQYLTADWQIVPIANVNEETCAAMLFESRIFLAFSEFEGLPLPPLEAALAGNLVIGYTGQGAREYWDAPNFQDIPQGEICRFVMAAAQATRDMDAQRLTDADLAPGIDSLVERFSPTAEAANLQMVLGHIERCFAYPPVGARVAELV
jgi:hypothetical protein